VRQPFSKRTLCSSAGDRGASPGPGLLRDGGLSGYADRMAGWDDVTTYDDLKRMTPAERREHFRSCIILDPSTRPARERAHLEKIQQGMNEETRAREERLRGQAS